MMSVACASREKIVYFIKSRQQCVTAILNTAKYNFSVSANETEYTERPKYPPILDPSRRAIRERKEREWHEKIRSLETVEEKLFALNLPRYYGWRSLLLTEGHLFYDTFKFFQYITRTHFSPVEELPLNCEKGSVLSDDLFNKIKNRVQDALVFEYKCRRRKDELEDRNNMDKGKMENEVASSVIKQINRILLANLSPFAPHLLEAQVDFEPRVEAFWFVGGMDPSRQQRKGREGLKFLTKEEVESPADRPVQYFGSPVLQLRHELPLPVISTEKLQPVVVTSIEHFQFDPRVLGYSFTHRNGTTIPGFWPGDECEFGLISFHTRGHLYHRREFCGTYDEDEALHSQAILASYAWLLAQACYKGFSTYNDVTYPFVTQTVVTNGQLWSLYTYQLNTTLVHSEYASTNEKCNICWGTAPLKLFDEVKDTQVVGFNDKLLKMIIALYTTAPQERVGLDLRPYLKEGKHMIALIDDPARREWLEARFKHMYSCRPRMRLPYELYHWEKIYKVDHKTRPMDARRRPFELSINPFRRRYDEHVPEYIPKSLRPEEDKKTKWEKTYYPLSENDYKKSRRYADRVNRPDDMIFRWSNWPFSSGEIAGFGLASHFSRAIMEDGLHLNYEGKHFLCDKLSKLITEKIQLSSVIYENISIPSETQMNSPNANSSRKSTVVVEEQTPETSETTTAPSSTAAEPTTGPAEQHHLWRSQRHNTSVSLNKFFYGLMSRRK